MVDMRIPPELDVYRRKKAASAATSPPGPPGDDEELRALAPEIPFDEIWTPEPDAKLVIPALGVAPGPVHLVTGSWYTGKTLFLISMGLSVASGRDLFGLYGAKRGKWMHFDHEMGRRHLKRYMQRLREGAGIEVESLRGYVSLRPLPFLNLTHPKAIEHYSRLLEGYAFATIDPLRAAAPGENENDSEFRQWLDLLGTVSERTECAIGVLHHGGKPTDGAARRNIGRGTSAIDDAGQSKFVLSAEEKGAPMLVTHEKTRELPSLLEDFYLRIENGSQSVRLVHMNVEEMEAHQSASRELKERERVLRAKESIRDAFTRFAGRISGTRDDVVKVAGAKRQYAQKALSELLAEGCIRKTRADGTSVFELRQNLSSSR